MRLTELYNARHHPTGGGAIDAGALLARLCAHCSTPAGGNAAAARSAQERRHTFCDWGSVEMQAMLQARRLRIASALAGGGGGGARRTSRRIAHSKALAEAGADDDPSRSPSPVKKTKKKTKAGAGTKNKGKGKGKAHTKTKDTSKIPTSKYRGVSWETSGKVTYSRAKPWRVRIGVGSKQHAVRSKSLLCMSL